MNDTATLSPYGRLIEPATLKIERLLPGPIERVWAYLTESELRRKWLAAGAMELTAGAAFTLTWRNEELNDPPGRRPPGHDAEHSMPSRIIALDPPRRLVIAWGMTGAGEVSFELEPRGNRVLLTLIHRRIPDRAMMLKIGAGWHMHLDMLAARVAGEVPPDFWSGWEKLHAEYAARLPG